MIWKKACKKKNQLYEEYIKHQTKEKEDKYKKYKNKLTDIMREIQYAISDGTAEM